MNGYLISPSEAVPQPSGETRPALLPTPKTDKPPLLPTPTLIDLTPQSSNPVPQTSNPVLQTSNPVSQTSNPVPQSSNQIPSIVPPVAFPLPDVTTPPPQLPFFRAPPPPLITHPPPSVPRLYVPPPTFNVPPPTIPPLQTPYTRLDANCSIMQSTPTIMTSLPAPVLTAPIVYANPNTVVVENQYAESPYEDAQITLNSSVPVEQVEEGESDSENSPEIEKIDPQEIQLPPNWRAAKDGEGNIYYYHAVTRQAQWDPPPVEENEEICDNSCPPPDESKPSRRQSSTTAAPADTSFALEAEVAKKVKERFRLKVSTYVVHCLNPYRKPDCRCGRITSTKDFKHLARKLTHFIMSKEIKQCKNIIEDLECNIDVKCKTKDYIKTYMSKYGPIYRKDKSPQ